LSIRSWWVKGERPKPNEVLFEAVVLSLVNQLLALFTLRGVLSGVLDPSGTPFLVAEVLIQPVLLGLVAGWLADRNWMPDGFRRLLMPSVRPVGSALAFAFDRIDEPAFIIATYADGRTVYGYFGSQSLARSNEDGGIFLESLYTLDDTGDWVEASPRLGAVPGWRWTAS